MLASLLMISLNLSATLGGMYYSCFIEEEIEAEKCSKYLGSEPKSILIQSQSPFQFLNWLLLGILLIKVWKLHQNKKKVIF